MAKKKPATKIEEPDPLAQPGYEEETPQVEAPAEIPPAVDHKEVPSKADAIREAIGQLGVDAKVSDIQSYIQIKYSMEVAAPNIYQVKNKMKGGGVNEESSESGRKGRAASPSSSQVPHIHTNGLSIQEVTSLVHVGKRVGWANLKELIDSLSE